MDERVDAVTLESGSSIKFNAIEEESLLAAVGREEEWNTHQLDTNFGQVRETSGCVRVSLTRYCPQCSL